MALKMVMVVAVCCMIMIFMNPAQSSEDKVRDINGASVGFGVENAFVFVDDDHRTLNPYNYHFGNGKGNVLTDTTYSLSILTTDEYTSEVLACEGGRLVTLKKGAVSSIPKNARVKVLEVYSRLYALQITDDPKIYVHFDTENKLPGCGVGLNAFYIENLYEHATS